jgi:hypothetical protein
MGLTAEVAAAVDTALSAIRVLISSEPVDLTTIAKGV